MCEFLDETGRLVGVVGGEFHDESTRLLAVEYPGRLCAIGRFSRWRRDWQRERGELDIAILLLGTVRWDASPSSAGQRVWEVRLIGR